MGMITILKKKTGYGLGLSLCIIGIVLLLVVVWKWWDAGVFASPDMLSALSGSLTYAYADISLGIGLTLGFYVILGAVLLGTGSAILLLRREKVAVTEGLTVVLECPFCKNQWRESMSKSHLKAMGYPEVRTLYRRNALNAPSLFAQK
jgi:ABC-type Fe3+ transport system permease subunit